MALDYSDWRVESADLRGSRRCITKCWPSSKKPPAPCHCQQFSPRPNIPPRMLDNHLPKSRVTPFTPPFNSKYPGLVPPGREHYPKRGKPYATCGAQTRTTGTGRAGWSPVCLPPRRRCRGWRALYELESAAFKGFCRFLTGNMSDQLTRFFLVQLLTIAACGISVETRE